MQAGISQVQKHSQDPEWEGSLLEKLGATKHVAVDAAKDVVAAMAAGMKHIGNDPLHALAHPLESMERMGTNYGNERENRILVGHQRDGTAIYMRLPFGKVGEEMQGWMTRPFVKGPDNQPSMIEQKESTIIRPFWEAFQNDKGMGQHVYKDSDPFPVKAGKSVVNFFKEQFPTDTIESVWRMLRGEKQEMDPFKFWGPLTGLTFSKGAPGGPEVGELLNQMREHRSAVADNIGDIKRAIKAGDMDTANRLMDEARMSPMERKGVVKHTLHPETYLSKRNLQQFNKTATPEQQERMSRARQSASNE